MATDEREFLNCMQQIEEQLAESSPEEKRAWRRLGVHFIRLHQEIAELTGAVQKIVDGQTVNGEQIDLKSSYQILLELVERENKRDERDEQRQIREQSMARQFAWAQAGVWIFGALAPFAVGLAVYQVRALVAHDDRKDAVDMQQTIALTQLQSNILHLTKAVDSLNGNDGRSGH